MPEVDVLLRVLSGEVDVMRRATKVRGAQHACMIVGDIETARITSVPITVTFDRVGIRHLLGPLSRSLVNHRRDEAATLWADGLSVRGGRFKLSVRRIELSARRTELASRRADGVGVRWDRRCIHLRWRAIRWYPTNRSGAREHVLTHRGMEHGSAATTVSTAPGCAITATTAASSIPCIATPYVTYVESNRIQSVNDLMEGGVRRILHCRKLRNLLFLALRGCGGSIRRKLTLIGQSRNL